MAPYTNLFDALKLGLDSWRMVAEAQMVIGLRLYGMAGGWKMTPGETTRMVTEKQSAFTQAGAKALAAAVAGKSADKVLDAALRPLGRRTAANSKRLGRSVWRQMW